MELGSLLKPEAVKVAGNLTSKKRVLRELGEITATAYGLDPNIAVEALQDRESIGTTCVGGGVALPHARLSVLDHVIAVFLRLEHPLPFGAVDRQPVDLIFTLFAPEDCGVSHLKALAAVSRVMRDSAVCTKLRSNDDPAVLYTVLTGAQSNKAA